MITIEMTAVEDGKLKPKTVALTESKQITLEALNDPIELPAEAIGREIGVYICSPDNSYCTEVFLDEYEIRQNILTLRTKLLKRFNFVPGCSVIITIPKPYTLITSPRQNEVYYSVLVKSLDEVVTNVEITPVIKFDNMKKYVKCSLIDETGAEVQKVRYDTLGEEGVVLLIKLTFDKKFFEKVEPGDYPIVDLQIEYY